MTRTPMRAPRATAPIARSLATALGVLAVVLALSPQHAAAQAPTSRTPSHSPPTSRAAKIANAITAGPEEIARNATVKDWPASKGAPFVVLREGTNGWVCLPDYPATPGNDPNCLDRVWQKVFEAFTAERAPVIDGVGYAYMLSSDSEGSNTDPAATAPTPDNHWHHQGPHLMVIYPDPKLLEGLPTTPNSGAGPYVMYPGTPLAHVMWPVQSGYAIPSNPREARSRRP